VNALDNDKLRGLLTSPTDFAIITFDLDGNLALWNAGASSLFGLHPGMSGASVAALLEGKSSTHEPLRQHMADALLHGRTCLTGWYCGGPTQRFWGEGTLSPIYDSAGHHTGYLKIIRDVSERQRAEQDVLVALHTDDLTGLSNRSAFHARLHENLGATSRYQHLFILHLIDLDYFKTINDTLGHQAGDMLLCQVGKRIRAVCRETDMVARLGGDEFAIIQGDVATAGDGSVLASKVLHALTQPFLLGDTQAGISASMGLAVAPQDGVRPDELLRKADAALYRAKHNGRAAFSYFTASLEAEAQNRHRDIGALHDAVREQSFFVAYQPNLSPADHSVVGMEALLRCSHPVLAGRPIRDVIRLAEQCGQMGCLSHWVLQQACRQARSWFDQGHPKFKLCINLCARELGSPSTPEIIDRTLAGTGLQASDLHVELTEQELYESKGDGVAVLHGLSERGIAIALDDFGTGYSSLNNLTTLPLKLIKLDTSFIRQLPQDKRVAKIVAAIVDLAHALDLTVAAEGIERQDQLDSIRAMRCDIVQGYYFSRPLAASRMERWLRTRPMARARERRWADH
jgi:diguanylate cyclase (GGDEF)-like protein/PAS domain S-box-containing protein